MKSAEIMWLRGEESTRRSLGITLFNTEDLKNYTLLGGTSPYRKRIGVPLPPSPPPLVKQGALSPSSFTNFFGLAAVHSLPSLPSHPSFPFPNHSLVECFEQKQVELMKITFLPLWDTNAWANQNRAHLSQTVLSSLWLLQFACTTYHS